MRDYKIGIPLEILSRNVAGRKGEFDTMRTHTCDICIFGNLPSYTHCVDNTDQIIVIASIPVKHQVNAIINKTDICTKVYFVFLFVGELTVFQIVYFQT